MSGQKRGSVDLEKGQRKLSVRNERKWKRSEQSPCPGGAVSCHLKMHFVGFLGEGGVGRILEETG